MILPVQIQLYMIVSLLQAVLHISASKINKSGSKNETNNHYDIWRIYIMPRPKAQTGEKNLISQQLIELRRRNDYSQRDLAYKLQLAGYDMDKKD